MLINFEFCPSFVRGHCENLSPNWLCKKGLELMNIVSMPKIFRLPCIERFLDAPLLKKKRLIEFLPLKSTYVHESLRRGDFKIFK